MEHYGNTLAKSVIEKRIESANELPLSLQESFAVSNGWKYPTQSEFDTAYKRLEKVRNGNYLTLDEFIAEAGEQRYENTKRVFEQLERIRQTYNTLDPTRIYLYAKYNWCFARPEAIVAAWSSEDHVWYVNNCDTIISESQAKEKIEDCLGFKKEVIEILGTPFYESSDWQFIRFRCRGWYWLWAEGKLTKS